ncbi:unnamed protein product, partial [Amoebophrya sp. A25]|eukprot:GSA25T00015110001.1
MADVMRCLVLCCDGGSQQSRQAGAVSLCLKIARRLVEAELLRESELVVLLNLLREQVQRDPSELATQIL